MEEDPGDASEARLDAIKRDGRARRARRHRRNAGVLAVALVIVAGGGALVIADAGKGTTSSPEAAHDTPSRGPEAARTVAPGCVNSTDAACGPFHWDPEPARNRPLTATLRVAPDAVRVGQQVTATVTWSDPDAPAVDLVAECWGDGGCSPPPPGCTRHSASGSWTPPPPRAGRGKLVLRAHSYSSSGRYPVTVTVRSRSWPGDLCPPSGDPYTNTTTVRTVVTIR